MKKALAFLLAVCLLIISTVSLADESTVSEKEAIEYALNLQHMDQEWTYNSGSDAWTLSIVTAVTKPVRSWETPSPCMWMKCTGNMWRAP